MSLRYYFLMVLLIAPISQSLAQTWLLPAKEWSHTYGGTAMDVAKEIHPTTDGGFIMVGNTTSSDGDVTVNNGQSDVWVVKLDSGGAIVWQQTFGGSAIDSGETIQQTLDGGYIVGAITYSSDSGLSANHGNSDYWLLKLDNNGTVQWSQLFGGTGFDNLQAVKQTKDSGFVACGTSNSTDFDVTGNHGLNDYWVIRVDKTGALVTQKSYGGSGDDYGTDILQAVGFVGDLVISGYSNSIDGDLTGNFGGYDFWVLKVNKTLDSILWQTNLGGTYDELAYGLIQNEALGYTIVGGSNSNDSGLVTGHIGKPGPTGSFDLWIVKLSFFGVKFWENSVGGYGDEFGYNVVQNPIDSGFTVVCKTNSPTWYGVQNIGAQDLYVFRIRWNGYVDFGAVYGGTSDDFGYGIGLLSNESIILAGGSYSSDSDIVSNQGMCDAWAILLGAPVNLSVNDYSPYNNSVATVYPNPFNSTATLLIKADGFYGKKNILNIYNIQGQMVRSYQVGNKTSITLDKSFLTSGMYYYQLESDGSIVATGKLIAQ